jgi:ABC-2 type transport system permease protein
VAGLTPVWTLVVHQLRTRWRSLLIWGVALGGLGALYVALYPTMSGFLNDYIKNAPESMQKYLGGLQGPITIEQWLSIELGNAIIPIALPFLVMLIGSRAVAGSEERKTLDPLLSNPLSRWQVIAGSAVTMAISLAGVLAMTWVLTYIAVPLAGVHLAPGHLAAGLAALWAFCLFFGALALLVSALVRRAALAVAIPAAVLVAMYVIDGLAQSSKSVQPLRVVSLFYHLGRPLEGDFPWTAVLGMLAGVCILVGAAMAAFARRDIYT